MRRIKTALFGSFLAICISSPLFATFQVASPVYHDRGRHRWYRLKGTNYPRAYSDKRYYFVVHKGSLRSLVHDMAAKYGWRVKWYARTGWYVVSDTKIEGKTFPTMTQQLLRNYPLKTVYHSSRRTLSVYTKKQ
jgi:hypothetical protein